MRTEMKALIEHWVEELHEQDLCLRLMIDATTDGVVVPGWVKDRWKEALPIDLDPSYPLDLRYEDEGLHCCLSFGGPWDCFFPWTSIYLVQARDSPIGVVIDENLPGRLRLALEQQGDRERETASEGARVGDCEPKVVAEPAVDRDEGAAEAKRSRFRVIDGGKR